MNESKGKTLVLGDIHGCLMALEAVLSAANAHEEDTIIALGDMIDRGPDSYGVIKKLKSFNEKGELIPLRGNHEIMMAHAIKTGRDRSWLKSGGLSTLVSLGYKGSGPWQHLIPDGMLKFLIDECVNYWENSRFIMTHAGLEAGLPLDNQPDSVLFWNKAESDPIPHFSGKLSIHGHTVMQDYHPCAWPHTWFLDTGVYLDQGWLTCVNLDSQQVWQANQKGVIRPGIWMEGINQR